MAQETDIDTRVLVLAPTGRDGIAASEQLGKLGLVVGLCHDASELVAKLDDGAGVAVIAEEALKTGLAVVETWVARQPAWSDFPFVVLTGGHLYPKADAHRVRLLQRLGSVTLLERPLSTISLASIVQVALRARRRQYQTRAILEDLKASEERLRLFR
jgi:hypothetical protein